MKPSPRLTRARHRVNTVVAALRSVPHRRYVLILAGLLMLVMLTSGIGAHAMGTWVLENTPVVLGLLFLWSTYRLMPLSRVSYTLIFLFTCLHEIGAHWTYARVPYDEWWHTVFNTTLNSQLGFERNHFDRLVHFSYGLLIAYPIREIFLRLVKVDGFWGYFLPLDVTLSTSALYELLEWVTASVVGSDAGNDFLGSQGDIWDAQKDMAMAGLGAVFAMTLSALIAWRYDRDFAREFTESLKLKHTAPLGEEEIARIQTGSAKR